MRIRAPHLLYYKQYEEETQFGYCDLVRKGQVFADSTFKSAFNNPIIINVV